MYGDIYPHTVMHAAHTCAHTYAHTSHETHFLVREVREGKGLVQGHTEGQQVKSLTQGQEADGLRFLVLCPS